jgi:hypothetical protein
LLVAFIVAATAAFVVGVALERHETVESPFQRAAGAGTPSRTGESGESGEQHSESGESKPPGETAAHTEAGGHVESSEKLLGVDPESTGLVAVAVVTSLLLAAAVRWRGGSPLVLAVVAVAMAAFTALDVGEVVHQVNESRTGLAVVAGAVAVLHVTAAVVAGRAAVTARGLPPQVASAA